MGKNVKYILVMDLKTIHKVNKTLTDEQGVYFETSEGTFCTWDCLLLSNLLEVKEAKRQLNAVVKF